MKTNMTQKGFTLIELLVVIVIIGILATISVATFSGYFAKARDTERQTFTAAARTALQAEQISSQTSDFRLAATNNTGPLVEAAVVAALEKQGIVRPDLVGSAATYYYVVEAADFTVAATNFAFVACGEEEATTRFVAGSFTPAGACNAGVFDDSAATEAAIAITTLTVK